MTETTLALCKTPVLGLMMWLSSQCVTNQALKDAYVDLSVQGVILSESINVPMDEKYSLFLTFRPTGQRDPSATPEPFASYICRGPAKAQTEPSSLAPSQPLSLEMEITTPDGKLVSKGQFTPQCSPGANYSNTLSLGNVEMKRGKFKLSITNLYPIALNNSGKVQVIFHGMGAGYP